MTATAHVSAYLPTNSALQGQNTSALLRTFTFGPYVGGTTAAAGDRVIIKNTNVMLFVLPEAGEIEKITVRCSAVAAAAATFAISVAAPGVAVASAVPITAYESLAAANITAVNTPFDIPILTTGVAKNLASGTAVWLQLSNDQATTSLADFVITIVMRTQPKRTNDDGTRVY